MHLLDSGREGEREKRKEWRSPLLILSAGHLASVLVCKLQYLTYRSDSSFRTYGRVAKILVPVPPAAVVLSVSLANGFLHSISCSSFMTL